MATDTKMRKLDDIADNLMTFFPLFYRNVLSVPHTRFGVTHINMEMRAIFMLNNSAVLPTSEIGRRLGISKPNVTTLLDKLVEKGYVDRVPDARDRRIVNIVVTEKGKQFNADKKRALRKVIKRNMAALGQDDVEALSAAFWTVKDILSRIGGK